MNIILTGGGTAGHVMPCLALVPSLKRHFDNVYYVGSSGGIERDLATRAGLQYYAVSTVKLRRDKPLKNIGIPLKLLKGIKEARALIDCLCPSVVFAKGGYVSLPMAIAARQKGVPVVLHESDLTMGVANKIISGWAAEILTAFPETAQQSGGKCVGIPLREDFHISKGKKAPRDRKTLLVMGGSLGAGRINDFIRASYETLSAHYDIIHVTGKGKAISSISLPHYVQIEFTDKIAELIRFADVVVSRAGATTVFELAALKKPAVLIPLTGRATRGDQILNARSFERAGYAVVIEEKDLNIAGFLDALSRAEQLTPPPYDLPSHDKIASIIAAAATPNVRRTAEAHC